MKPILFNTEMVKAILSGHKTETRRPIKQQPWISMELTEFECSHVKGFFDTGGNNFACKQCGHGIMSSGISIYKAKYLIGDILHVRETFCDRWLPDGFLTGHNRYGYKADGVPEYGYWGNDKQCKADVWIPSIHMPKEAARIFLKVTDVKVERLSDITENDAINEGMPSDDDYPLESVTYCNKCNGTGLLGALGHNMGYTEIDCNNCDTSKKRFMNLWDSIYADYPSKNNPWVFVYKFKICDKEGNVTRC